MKIFAFTVNKRFFSYFSSIAFCDYLTVTDGYETSLRCFNFTLGEINLNFVILNFNSAQKP